MSSFSYQALDATGERVQGVLDAKSRSHALIELEKKKLKPIKLQEVSSVEVSSGGEPSGGMKKLSRSQVISFTEEMSDLLEGGLQLEPALQVMEKRSEEGNLRVVAQSLRQKIRDGMSFSAAIRSERIGFDELYCSMIAAGEIAGALPDILKRQLGFLKAIDELRSKVIQSLLYPTFLIVAGVGLMGVFMTVLVPQLTTLMTKTGKTLPLATRVLIDSSEFLQTKGWLLFIVISVLVLLFSAWIQSKAGRPWWHRFQYQIPLLGPVLMAQFLTQWTYTLSSLIANGIPLHNGLQLLKASASNLYWNRVQTKMVNDVAEGLSLSKSMEKTAAFPPALIDLIRVGEQTGSLAKSLEKISLRYDKSMTIRISRITALIQPTIIVCLAILIGAIAYSIVTGIFQTLSGIGK
ncbi:MAG: type II secretion system F family protein [Verrucomicrobiota bacterium]